MFLMTLPVQLLSFPILDRTARRLRNSHLYRYRRHGLARNRMNESHTQNRQNGTQGGNFSHDHQPKGHRQTHYALRETRGIAVMVAPGKRFLRGLALNTPSC